MFDEDVTKYERTSGAQRGLANIIRSRSRQKFTALDNVLLASQRPRATQLPLLAQRATNATAMAKQPPALATVGLGAMHHATVGTMAHGEQRQQNPRWHSATEPKLLLLDGTARGHEPGRVGAIVALFAVVARTLSDCWVEHDMEAVFALADRVSVLVYGRIIATGCRRTAHNPEVRAAHLSGER